MLWLGSLPEVILRCPYCRGDDTRVVDSRDSDGGDAVRRRRQCGSCDRRFTTFERAEEAPLVLVKRDGSREPFDRAKVVSGVAKACKNRPVGDDAMLRLTDQVEEALRAAGSPVTSQDVGREVLSRLRELDQVAYVRFASVYSGFQDVEDFERVIRDLDKSSPPKARGPRSRAVSRDG
ncbi:MAG TPA: transcriptional regulator NrdR [Actinomycetota bacterium]|nr:transcriptional regulator NrdR [Actinomycetota bacterium]